AVRGPATRGRHREHRNRFGAVQSAKQVVPGERGCVRYPFARGHPDGAPIGDLQVANTDQGRPTKAQRKEQARIEREEIQRKQPPRSPNRIISLVVGASIAVGVVALVLVLGGGNGNNPGSQSSAVTSLPPPDTLPGILKTAPPWSNNTEQLPARLAALD